MKSVEFSPSRIDVIVAYADIEVDYVDAVDACYLIIVITEIYILRDKLGSAVKVRE